MSEASNSLISVITPFYNEEAFLSEAILSVIKQSYSNWELILISDGSTDNSLKIASRFANSDIRITILSKENGGVSSARNFGLSIMKGDYFCFLDADDKFPVDSLKERINYAKRNELDCVDGLVKTFTGSIKKSMYTPCFRGEPMEELIKLSGKCFFSPTWLMKKKTQLIPFNNSISHGEDLLFLIENYGKSSYGYINIPVLEYLSLIHI